MDNDNLVIVYGWREEIPHTIIDEECFENTDIEINWVDHTPVYGIECPPNTIGLVSISDDDKKQVHDKFDQYQCARKIELERLGKYVQERLTKIGYYVCSTIDWRNYYSTYSI